MARVEAATLLVCLEAARGRDEASMSSCFRVPLDFGSLIPVWFPVPLYSESK